MKIGGRARFFAVVTSTVELQEAVTFAKEKGVSILTLGGGSNMLISGGEMNALVIKVEIRGIEWGSHSLFLPPRDGSASGGKGSTPSSEEGFKSSGFQPPPLRKACSRRLEESLIVTVGAGESWDGLVAQAVERGLWGIENLSGVPGSVGAAPIQNIGAYGTEVKEVTLWVEVFDINTGEIKKLTSEECEFGYRDSIFKHAEGKPFVVTRVAFRLRKNGTPNLTYKDLRESFKLEVLSSKEEQERRLKEITISEIRKRVIEIRSNKFPDLKEFGTAGSFFKNPIISTEKFSELKRTYPNLPGFELRTSNLELRIKVSLAWVLDNICGLKGFEKGNVKLFEKQPIVLVQNGSASSEEIEAFAKEIIANVKEKTGIEVEWEVQHMK